MYGNVEASTGVKKKWLEKKFVKNSREFANLLLLLARSVGFFVFALTPMSM